MEASLGKKERSEIRNILLLHKEKFSVSGPWFQFSSYAVHYGAADVLVNREKGLDAMSYCMIKTEGEGFGS